MPPEAQRAAAALVLLGPFVPLLFAGEEWAASSPFQYFTDHRDEALGAAVREGRRREFPDFLRDGIEIPDPQAVATFERSRLDWTERSIEPHAAMLAWYRRLIAFRAAHDELRDGTRPTVTVDTQHGWMVMAQARLRIVANLGPAPRTVPLEGSGPWQIALASDDGLALAGSGVALLGWSVAVVKPAG